MNAKEFNLAFGLDTVGEIIFLKQLNNVPYVDMFKCRRTEPFNNIMCDECYVTEPKICALSHLCDFFISEYIFMFFNPCTITIL